MIGVYKKGKFGHRKTRTQGERPVRMKAEVGVMWPQAEECQTTPEAGRETCNRLFLSTLRRNYPANTLVSYFWPPEL